MKNRIAAIDGIRGCLALWVFWGHLSTASGARVPVLSVPALAVDLFMLLSGFLMTWHWELAGPTSGPWSKRVFEFYVRRFFRLAPLYYLLFVVSLWITPAWLNAEHSLYEAFPPPFAENLPPTFWNAQEMLTPANVLTHFTFLFGLLPHYASNNALPDWSLSLEMQFYLCFPLLVFLVRRSRVLAYAIGATLLAAVVARLFGLYLSAGPLGNFPQPSFLPFRLHAFASGMILGWLAAHKDADSTSTSVFWLAFFVPLIWLNSAVAVAAVGIAAILVGDLPMLAPLQRLFSSRPLKFLGDVSYALYLVHLPFVFPVLNFARTSGWWGTERPMVRLAYAILALTPIVLGVSYLLFRFIEQPGIALGKLVLRRSRARVPENVIRDARAPD